MKGFLKSLARKAGYEVLNLRQPGSTGLFPPDFDEAATATYLQVRPFTMTPPERVLSLIRAVEYVVDNDIPGSFVECGVWKGGSMMTIARTLLRANRNDRELFLYDTYEGMPQPIEADGEYAQTEWAKHQQGTHKGWACAQLDEVKANMASTGFPLDRIRYIPGKVEDTLPASAPESISLLRLDTDFYESTKHELVHLFPRLSHGGVLIIDDYGAFPGARKAVDEYIHDNNICIFLNRIDVDARLGIKIDIERK